MTAYILIVLLPREGGHTSEARSYPLDDHTAFREKIRLEHLGFKVRRERVDVDETDIYVPPPESES